MATYFAFNDDCGNYIPQPTENQVSKDPFYLRATLLMESSEYRKLCKRVNYRKRKHKIPEDREIKWSYAWTLRNHKKNSKPIDPKRKYAFLADFDYHTVIDYIQDTLTVIDSLDYASIIFTVTPNCTTMKFDPHRMHQMHLETTMQRIEMELNSDTDGLCVLFLDPESKKSDCNMRDTYYKLRADGGLLKEHKKIKDSINFEDSNHSIGIQLTDLIAGSFGAFLKSVTSNTYERGKQMFLESVFEHIRQQDDELFGYGICEIPTDAEIRANLRKSVENIRHCESKRGQIFD